MRFSNKQQLLAAQGSLQRVLINTSAGGKARTSRPGKPEMPRSGGRCAAPGGASAPRLPLETPYIPVCTCERTQRAGSHKDTWCAQASDMITEGARQTLLGLMPRHRGWAEHRDSWNGFSAWLYQGWATSHPPFYFISHLKRT